MSELSLKAPVHVAVVTGTRADFGLLRPVMRAIDAHERLVLSVIVSGTHLIGDSSSVDAVIDAFPVEARVAMQRDGVVGRAADVAALGRGVSGFGVEFERLKPDVVLVLGDRIEAFAAASAGSVGGRLVAHIHGGDRAEGVADEAMRHAISKMAHVHFPATRLSAERLQRMGEDARWIFTAGSPAIDDLDSFDPLDDAALAKLGVEHDQPFGVVLHHPCGLEPEVERSTMRVILGAIEGSDAIDRLVLLAPNRDPGRESVLEVIGDRSMIDHLPRDQFVGLLKRASVLVGNSSAGLIEAAALGLPVVNVGPRQAGREREGHVVDVELPVDEEGVGRAIDRAVCLDCSLDHPYGDGDAGVRIADCLAGLIVECPSVRKRCVY